MFSLIVIVLEYLWINEFLHKTHQHFQLLYIAAYKLNCELPVPEMSGVTHKEWVYCRHLQEEKKTAPIYQFAIYQTMQPTIYPIINPYIIKDMRYQYLT